MTSTADPKPIAVLDACVMWSGTQRDFLLSLAGRRAFDPRWGQGLLDEVARNEIKKLAGKGAEFQDAERRAARLIRKMDAGFENAHALAADVNATMAFARSPDANDRHVIAAALVQPRADLIVTDDATGFPSSSLPPSMRILTAREFAAEMARRDPHAVLGALNDVSSHRHRPCQSPRQVLEHLEDRNEMKELWQVVEPQLASAERRGSSVAQHRHPPQAPPSVARQATSSPAQQVTRRAQRRPDGLER